MQDEFSGQISEVTRRIIADSLASSWPGKLGDADFLKRLYDLKSLPSHDGRFSNAAGDIWQHTVMNPTDWEPDWVFTDSRFRIMWAPDEEFLRFIAETVHPAVRDPDKAAALVEEINRELEKDGWMLRGVRQLSGRPVYGAVRLEDRAVVFDEPTGWPKVDRQIQRARKTLNLAEGEEQFQAVGHLSREILISAAQATYDEKKYPPLTQENLSSTDSVGMIEAIFAVELAGGSNEKARAHAKASLNLANEVQHRRTATFRDAALSLEGACAVVNVLAVLMGRRDRH